MNTAEPLPSSDHLRLLSVFHYIWAGLGLVGLGFLALHYGFMQTMLDPDFLARQPDPPPPEMIRMFGLFKWMYLGFALFGITTMVLNFLAARWIAARSHWMFCVVVAALNCLSIPLGTILGVFTIVVLTKDPVRRSFA
jgi:hypothetical protein